MGFKALPSRPPPYFRWLSVRVIPCAETLKCTMVAAGAGSAVSVSPMALAMAWGPVSDSISTELMKSTLQAVGERGDRRKLALGGCIAHLGSKPLLTRRTQVRIPGSDQWGTASAEWGTLPELAAMWPCPPETEAEMGAEQLNSSGWCGNRTQESWHAPLPSSSPSPVYWSIDDAGSVPRGSQTLAALI